MNEAPTTKYGSSKIKKLFCWVLLGIIAVLIAIPVCLIGCFFIGPFEAVNQADAGFRRAKKHIDPEQVRAWAFATVKSHNGTNGYIHHVENSEIPDYLVNLYSIPPEMAWVSPNATDQDVLVGIVWGGGFFHWGFYIGTTNYVKEPTGDHVIAEWTNGIYYAHEGSRKIR